jgi:Type VI secretion system/phage-baseplate injector OB domain
MAGQHFGKYRGEVVDNRDDQHLGRLQVAVPALYPDCEALPALPVLPYGVFFVPEVGAKVLVECVDGDPGDLVWTGVLPVPGSWPEEGKADPPQLRVIKTATGQLLILSDKRGEEGIEIRDAEHQHVVKLDKNGVNVTDGANKHELAMTSSGMTVKSSGALTLSGSSISINASAGNVEVDGVQILLGKGASLPVFRMTDQGVGNLGAPVALTVTPNIKVKA